MNIRIYQRPVFFLQAFLIALSLATGVVRADTVDPVASFTAPSEGYRINSLAVSPDGTTLLSGGLDRLQMDNLLMLWNAEDGSVIRTFSGHTTYEGAPYSSEVNAVAFSPDGKRAVSGSDDRTVIVWELATGNILHRLTGHTDSVESVAFAPDGNRILSGQACPYITDPNPDLSAYYGCDLILWDTEDGTPIRTFSGHTNAVTSVAFSPDGYTLLSSSYDGSVALWDGQDDGNMNRAIDAFIYGVVSAAFSPDGSYIIGGGVDEMQYRSLRLWDAETGTLLNTFGENTGLGTAVIFSPDGRYVLGGGMNEQQAPEARLWEVATAAEVRVFAGAATMISAVAFSPEGQYVYAASAFSNTITQWESGVGISPPARFTATPAQGGVPLRVALDATGSGLPEMPLIAFDWQVEGAWLRTPAGEVTAHSASGPRIEAIFDVAGEYEVVLTVTDAYGATAQASTSISVFSAPVAAFSAIPQAGSAPLIVALDALASTPASPQAPLVDFQWTSSGGTWLYPDGSIDTAAGSGPVIQIRFAEPGDYPVTLQVTDANGAVARAQQTVAVQPAAGQNQPPLAAFTLLATDSNAPAIVSVNAAASRDPDGLISAYRWQVGDMIYLETQPRNCFVLADPGVHEIRLTVIDNEGASATASRKLGVEIVPPQVALQLSPRQGRAPLEVDFAAEVQEPAPGQAVAAYLWMLSDGTVTTAPQGKWTFYRPGIYTVSLTVTDNAGLQATAQGSVHVTAAAAAPSAAFRIAPPLASLGEEGAVVTLTAEAEGAGMQYAWTLPENTEVKAADMPSDAPDDADTNQRSLTLSFTQLGDYKVSLAVTDSNGKSAQQTRTVYVKSKMLTGLTLETDSATLHNGGSLAVSGKLSSYPEISGEPAEEYKLSGRTIDLWITAPDGKQALTTAKTSADGAYRFGAVTGFKQAGRYRLRAAFTESDALLAAESAAQSVLVGEAAGYAILVQGKLNGDEEGLLAHNKTLQRIYKTLRARRIQEDNLLYFNYDTAQSGVDAAPDKATVLAAIAGEAVVVRHGSEVGMHSRLNGLPAPFYLVMVNHGSRDGGFYLGDEIITPAELDSALTTLENGLNATALAKPRIVMLGYCYSGAFVPELSRNGRILMTSATATEESYKGPREADGGRGGEFFLESLFQRLKGGDSLRQAFVTATTGTEIYTRRDNANRTNRFRDNAVQHPLLDDNGDREGSNLLFTHGDGTAAADWYLGYPPVDEADAGPAIQTVTPTLFLAHNQSSAELFITVDNAARVGVAAVEIRPPGVALSARAGDAAGQAAMQREIQGVAHEFLTCDEAANRCSVYSSVFRQAGQYEIHYFVRDARDGDLSPLRRSVVYKNRADNQPPAAFRLLQPLPGANPRSVLVFDWESSEDPDGDPLSYTLTVATDKTFSTDPVLRQEELPYSDAAAGLDAGLKDQTTYYWRVEAIDTYGARTAAPEAYFTTDNPNAGFGLISITVNSAVTPDTLVSGADISSDGASVGIQDAANNGPYRVDISQLPASQANLTINAPGYAETDLQVAVNAGTESAYVATVGLAPVAYFSSQTHILNLPLIDLFDKPAGSAGRKLYGTFAVTLRRQSTDPLVFALVSVGPHSPYTGSRHAEYSLDSGYLDLTRLPRLDIPGLDYPAQALWWTRTLPMQFVPQAQ